MRYSIWSKFTPEARRAAATADYRAGARRGRMPLTSDGSCPLGLALRVDAGGWSTRPGPGTVATALWQLAGRPLSLVLYADAILEARAFQRDWDAGRISPAALPDLLGVTDAAAGGPAGGDER